MVIDEEHFQQFVKGDEKAFEWIFHRYYKTLVSLSVRYVRELMEAEDIVLESFHHIWEIREEIASPVALHSLLFTAVKNRSLNVLRNLENRQRIIQEHLSEVEEAEEPTDYLVEEEMTRLLDEAISRLPKQCEQVVLGLLAGESLQEIADRMQISINSAKKYKLRAIQSLRKTLNGLDFCLLIITIRAARKKRQ